ncbi:uncharacterized protein LOC121738175 isoform X2 [Aricia agestis]|uniref:uncharacterized protein LOC121738175 isoform X2 n=1 Tax=Aricia agestis TaxID=91739 RepID=UPI001C205243|nr:uncharacterized protein LOC121738175 isoform X2 [Aricia agestis]
MVVFFIFGIFLASAKAFDNLELSPAVIDSNIKYVEIPPLPLPAEEKVPNAHDQNCPQNELLVQILNILTDQKSINYLDGPTKTPRVSAPVQHDVLIDESFAIPQKPSNNLVQIKYYYNRAPEYRPNDFQIQNPVVVPKADNNVEPVEEKVLWKNPYQPLGSAVYNIDQAPHGNPNDVYNNLLRDLIAIAQKPQHKTKEDKVKDVLPKSRIVQDPYIYSNANGQYLSPIDNQNPINNYDKVVPVPTGYDNIYEPYAQKGEGQSIVDPYSGKLQNQPGVNVVNVKQIADHDKIVEITYVLQQPKKVHYEPVYLIKYRLPLKVFEEHVYKLLLSKPFLKQDPNKLYQELLASLKLDNRFTQVTELRSKEINNMNNETENDNHVLTSKVKEIEDELKIIKELNANVSSSDLLSINNGTVENELKRLKRHPVLLNENII